MGLLLSLDSTHTVIDGSWAFIFFLRRVLLDIRPVKVRPQRLSGSEFKAEMATKYTPAVRLAGMVKACPDLLTAGHLHRINGLCPYRYMGVGALDQASPEAHAVHLNQVLDGRCCFSFQIRQ